MMATPTDLVPKRRKREEEEEEEHLLPLDQRGNSKEVNEKETPHDLLLQSQFPNWLQLPPDLSLFILSLISPSIPSLLSFSGVCSSWRSLAESSNLSISPPPLILSSCSFELNPSLKTLTPDLDPRAFYSLIPKAAVNLNCCGCSHGHLIFASDSGVPVLIADLFSSDEILLPKIPRGFTGITDGVLTAPPSSSSSSNLFLICSYYLLCWRLGGDNPSEHWSVYPLASGDDRVKSILVFNGNLHILHDSGAIFVLEFHPFRRWKRLPRVPCMSTLSYMRLAHCDGQLLLLCFDRNESYSSSRFGRRAQRYMWNKIKVYRMDFRERVWVKIRSIGDWCLFVDYIGKSPLACQNPGKWGGRSNHVYLAGPRLGPQFESWSALPLDGTEFEYEYEFKPTRLTQWQWTYPAWVYPTKLLMKFQQRGLVDH